MPKQDTEAPVATERGALEELARDDASRKRFLEMVGGAGAASAFAVFVAACGSDDDKKKDDKAASDTSKTKGGAKSDIDIVNYALTLEYLETAFYNDVIESGIVTDKAIGKLATEFAKEEQEHVDALKAAVEQLGGTPVEAPKTKFPLDSEQEVLKLAATVENLGAAAYLGAAPMIKSGEILAAALSIHTVEGRHAAALNTAVGETIVPDGAFAKPASMDEVLKAVKPFIVS